MGKDNFGINIGDIQETSLITLDDNGSVSSIDQPQPPDNKDKKDDKVVDKPGTDTKFDDLKTRLFGNQKIEIPDPGDKSEVIKEEKESNDTQGVGEGTKSTEEVLHLLTPYAATLKEKGVLPNLDLDEYNKLDPEAKQEMLITATQDNIKAGIENFVESLPPEFHDILKNYQEGVPLLDLVEAKDEQMRLDGITADSIKEDKDLQKELLWVHYKKTTRFSDEKIKKEITLKEESGKLEEDALDAHTNLVKISKEDEKALIDQRKKEFKDAQDRANKFKEDLTKSVTEMKEVIPGVPLTDKQKQNIINIITKPIGYDKNNRPISKVAQVRSKDPKSFEIKLAHYVDIGLFNDEINIKPIEGKIKNNITKGWAINKGLNVQHKPGEADTSNKDKDGVPIEQSIGDLLNQSGTRTRYEEKRQ